MNESEDPLAEYVGIRRFGRIKMRATQHVQAVPIPFGLVCSWCAEGFDATDSGLYMLHHGSLAEADDAEGDTFRPMHLECFERTVLGGAMCALGACNSKDHNPDPVGMTLREAAKAAMAVREMGVGRRVRGGDA